MVHTGTIALSAKGFCDTLDITQHVAQVLGRSGIREGTVTVFCPGSTASITTIEFEPGVVADLRAAIEKLVPEGIHYSHDSRWGDGNGFSHVRAALMKPSLSIPALDGSLMLGQWQQVVLLDFDNRPRTREIIVQVVGEP